jgi:hypothetical protein
MIFDAQRAVGLNLLGSPNRLLAQFVPLRVEDLALFQAAHHHKFILLSSDGGFDWFTQFLVERGYQLRLLSKDADGSLYIAEQ